MSFIGDEFSPAKGAGFQAQSSNVQSALGGGELEAGYGQTQSGLKQQQDFINALQAQNGIGNQSNVFAQQQALANQLGQQAQGVGPNPANAQLAQATGRNVEQQAALMGSQRGASANAGLMARQAAMRGGDIQQQSAGQAAVMNAQQQLAAQQALQQQQSMMGGLATQQVGQQAGAISNYNQFAQNQYGALLNSLAQQNSANVGMQQNVNTTMGGIAGINAQGQWQTTGGAANALGGGASKMMSGASAMGATGGPVGKNKIGNNPVMHNYADGGQAPQSFAVPISAPSYASSSVSGGASFSSPTLSDIMAQSQKMQDEDAQEPQKTNAMGQPLDYKGAGAKTNTPGLGTSDVSGANGPRMQPPVNMSMNNSSYSKGGAVYSYADGGDVGQPPPQETPSPAQNIDSQPQVSQSMPSVEAEHTPEVQVNKPDSFVGNFLSGSLASAPVSGGASFSSPTMDSGLEHVGDSSGGSGGGSGGGGSSSMMSMLPMLAMAASGGGKVPGKPMVKGDSLKNDVVNAKLSPGEIVLPRSVTQSENPVDASAKFVQAILAKHNMGKKNG